MAVGRQFGIVNDQIGSDDLVSRVFSLNEHLFALDLITEKRAKVYLWNAFGWDAAYSNLADGQFEREIRAVALILDKKNSRNFWIGMKPGDYRYCMHASDRRKFVENAKEFCEEGVDGIFLSMNDTHPQGRVEARDGAAQGELVYDLASALGSKLKGVCGEQYFGRDFSNEEYWTPILARLPRDALIAWCGPSVRNESLSSSDFPKLPRGLLVWDNYFASEFESAKEALFGEYSGRNPDLMDSANGFVISLNVPIKTQIMSIASALDFCDAPKSYDAKMSFLMNVRLLQQKWWEKETGEEEYHPLYSK